MKKILALLMALCMLASVAFAEAPAAEVVDTAAGNDLVAEEEAVDPQEAMLGMIDGLWQTALGSLVQNFNVGAEQIVQFLTQAGEQLNVWVESADARYQETRGSIADTALRLFASASEVAEEGRYISMGNEETQSKNNEKMEELSSAIQTVINLITEIAQEAQAEGTEIQNEVQARMMETKDQMIDSASEAITSFADIASNLVYVLTGAVDSNAQTRGIPGAEEASPVVDAANKLQDFLTGAVEFLSMLKDTEPAVEEAPAT